MKIRLLAAAIACSALPALAIVPYMPLTLPQGAHHPVLSPDGATLLFSTDSHTGLNAISLTNGKITVVDEGASAGFEPVFSTDGKTVYYRTAEINDGLMYRDVRSYNLAERKGRRLARPTRDKVQLSDYAGGEYAEADYKTIRVVKDGKETRVNPLADSHSYLWASLSPDGTRLIFSEPFQGVFVCNADGTEPHRLLKKGDYPAWAGDNTIIAVISHDDGYQILDSRLVTVDTRTGNTTDITAPDMLVSEATASYNGKVVFSDINGRMYTLIID